MAVIGRTVHSIPAPARPRVSWGQKFNKAFDAFFTTKEKGMGMGLAICRSIIEAHHGSLWIAPSQGPGATVSFTIPLQSSGARPR